MSGAFIFRGRDGCLRDLAGIHGTYRKVEENRPGIDVYRDISRRDRHR